MNAEQEINDSNNTIDMADRYQRAQSLVGGLLSSSLVQNDVLYPYWIGESDFFWYQRAKKLDEDSTGKEYRLVYAKTASNDIAFDHGALADALATVSGKNVDENNLPITQLTLNLSSSNPECLHLSFTAFEQRWEYDCSNKQCVSDAQKLPGNGEAVSPDGKLIAFVRDYNLWLRDVSSGEERAVTVGGEEYYGFGSSHTTWGKDFGNDLPAIWSPDSKRVLTVRRDIRLVKTIPLVDNIPADGSMRPKLEVVKVAYPGDEHVETFQLHSIDVASGKTSIADYPPMNTGYTHQWGLFNSRIAWWSNDNQRVFCIEQERGDRVLRLLEFDTASGNVRVLFEESSDTHVNLFPDFPNTPLHRYLSNSNELIWWSQRTGFGHLYLYDLNSGELKQTITHGEWIVRDVLHVDEVRREVIIQTAGRVTGRNPYYCDICRVNIDTGEITTLLSSDENLLVHYQESFDVLFKGYYGEPNGVSPNGEYIVLTRSRVDQAPVSLLIDRDGNTIMELERTITASLPSGWTWPEPIQVMAADEVTPLYGILFRPSNFSPDKQYPVINFLDGDPSFSIAASGSFNSSRNFYTDSHYFFAAALAELGFIVLLLDSRGTPLRSKTFHDESYGWAASAGNTDDHAGAIQQLAACYPYMDLNRVGLYGFAYRGGIQNFLERQDLYKVGVMANIMYGPLIGCSVIGDIWEGCDGPKDKLYPEDLAKNLKGKLLLMHPVNSSNSPLYPPAGPLRILDALQKADKDFDMLMIPGSDPSYGPYATRRIWNYFVQHLAQETPPDDVKIEVSMVF